MELADVEQTVAPAAQWGSVRRGRFWLFSFLYFLFYFLYFRFACQILHAVLRLLLFGAKRASLGLHWVWSQPSGTSIDGKCTNVHAVAIGPGTVLFIFFFFWLLSKCI